MNEPDSPDQDAPELDPDKGNAELDGPQIDDAEIRKDVLERVIGKRDSSPDAADLKTWTKVAVTDESVTVALEARVGCLVRVISWDLDGAFHESTTWCHGVTVADLLHGVRP